jgi:hypothetical protein
VAGGIQDTIRSSEADPEEDPSPNTDKDSSATGGNEDATSSFEADPKQDPNSATDKGFGAAGGEEVATSSSEEDPSSATNKGFGVVGEEILCKGGGISQEYAFSTATCCSRTRSTLSRSSFDAVNLSKEGCICWFIVGTTEVETSGRYMGYGVGGNRY